MRAAFYLLCLLTTFACGQFLINPYAFGGGGGGGLGFDKTNLVVWQDLDGDLTNNANPGTHDGTAKGTAFAYTTDPFSVSGEALLLLSTGGGSWAEIAGSAGLDPSGDYSLVFWFKDTNTGNTGTATLVQRWNFASGCSWRLSRQTGSNDRMGMLHTNDGANANQELEYTDVTDYPGDDGNWHHIAFTYDATASEGNFYVDGTNVKTVTWSTETGAIYGPGATTPLLIGTEDPSNAAFVTNGAIARFSLWHRELTGTEIGTLYNSNADVKYADL